MDFTRRIDPDSTVVEALDPKIIADVPDNPALAPIAAEAGQHPGRPRHKPNRAPTTGVL